MSQPEGFYVFTTPPVCVGAHQYLFCAISDLSADYLQDTLSVQRRPTIVSLPVHIHLHTYILPKPPHPSIMCYKEVGDHLFMIQQTSRSWIATIQKKPAPLADISMTDN